MDNSFTSRFERGVLFRIARFVAFSLCFLLFLSLVGGGLYLATTAFGKSIERQTPTELVDQMSGVSKPDPSASTDGNEIEDTPPPLKGIKLPADLQELFTNSQNQRWLAGRLEDLPEEERQQCIDGMAEAVRIAREKQMQDGPVVESWMATCHDYAAKKTLADAANKMTRLYVAGALVSLLMLIALFSLVLVLLAIERNTRPALAAP